jgi:hypothetical protein
MRLRRNGGNVRAAELRRYAAQPVTSFSNALSTSSITAVILVFACGQASVYRGPDIPPPQTRTRARLPEPVNAALQQLGCSKDTAIANIYRDGYASMVSRTDSQSVAQRITFNLPTLLPAQVIVIKDASLCAVASAAFDKTIGVSAPDEAPIVLQLGPRWVVVKHLAFRHVRPNLIFDSTFTKKLAGIWF